MAKVSTTWDGFSTSVTALKFQGKKGERKKERKKRPVSVCLSCCEKKKDAAQCSVPVKGMLLVNPLRTYVVPKDPVPTFSPCKL